MTHLRDVPCGPTLRSDSARGESHYPSPGSSPWRPETPRALVVAQRFPEPRSPTVSAAQPSQPRLGAPPVGRRAGRPVQRAPSRGRGGSPCPQPSNPETHRGLSVLEGWATSTFSRAQRPYRHCSAAPHFAPGACLGSRAGCPASTTPLTRAGQPPGPPAENACSGSCEPRRAPAKPAVVGNKADEARLLGGGETGFIGVRRAGRFLPSAWVSGPRSRRGRELADHARNARPRARSFAAILDERLPVQPLPR